LLLPNYDEFTVAYRERGLFYAREIIYRPARAMMRRLAM
jgi:hypothetical protein